MSKSIFMMVSRHKDNDIKVDGFKPRRKLFIADKDDEKRINDYFNIFCDNATNGEICRLYRSVNERDMDKVRMKLIAELAMNPQLDLSKIDNTIISLAMKPDCAETRHWMFDIDTLDNNDIQQFCQDVEAIINSMWPDKRPQILSVKPTLNGYHMILSHGIDTRTLMEKWSDKVTLLRDGMTLVKSVEKE